MQSGGDVSIQVSPEVVKPIIEAKIRAAVIAGLGGNLDGFVGEMIDKVLTSKVDNDGKQSRYSSDLPYLEWLTKKLIMEVARDAMAEAVQQHRDKIKAELKKAFNRRSGQIAENFLDHLEGASKDSWRTSVNVTFSKPG